MKKRYLAVGALAIGALVAALAACGGAEPAAEPSSPPATQPATTEAATTEAATTEAATTHDEMDEDEEEPGETTAPSPEPPAVVIEVRGSEPVGGIAKITVAQGDTVDFEVDSDVKGIVHVHGYDIEKKVTPSKPARLTFEATLEGIFEIELHLDGDETQIAELRVEP